MMNINIQNPPPSLKGARGIYDGYYIPNPPPSLKGARGIYDY
jgi:hypothetical protein